MISRVLKNLVSLIDLKVRRGCLSDILGSHGACSPPLVICADACTKCHASMRQGNGYICLAGRKVRVRLTHVAIGSLQESNLCVILARPTIGCEKLETSKLPCDAGNGLKT